jgi:hypothetical protein
MIKPNSVGESEISKAELLERLRRSKRSVTARQLERWSKVGLVARPVRRHVPGVRGSVSFFPAEAFSQAAAMFDAAQPANAGDRRLSKRAFLLWWSGERIAQDPRTLILATVSPLFKALERVRTEGQTTRVEPTSEDDDPAFDAADSFYVRHRREPLREPLLRATHKNLGRSESDFASFVITGLTIALGGMPLFGSTHIEGEPSLESLFVRGLRLNDLPPPEDGKSFEQQLPELIEPGRIFADRKELTRFVNDLGDDELETSRKFTRVFVEDIPVILEAYGVLFGKHPFGGFVQFLAKCQPVTRAQVIIGVAWLLRRHGTADCQRLVQLIEQARSRAQATCMLAKAFPEYRSLLLTRNAKQLAALPEVTRGKMLDAVRTIVPELN